jgi:hypothetical protein
VATRYAEREGEIQDAQAALEAAREKDRQAAVEAALAGEELDGDLSKNERDALVRADALKRTLAPLAQAVDEAGNALAQAIAPAAESWAAGFEAERDEAAARYVAAVQEAQAALEELGKAESARVWLVGFDEGMARAGQIPAWHGKAAPLAAEDRFGRQEDPRDLLELAADAAPRMTREQRRAERRAADDAEIAARQARAAEEAMAS